MGDNSVKKNGCQLLFQEVSYIILNFKTLASMHGSKNVGGIKSVMVGYDMNIRMDRQAISNMPEVFDSLSIAVVLKTSPMRIQ